MPTVKLRGVAALVAMMILAGCAAGSESPSPGQSGSAPSNLVAPTATPSLGPSAKPTPLTGHVAVAAASDLRFAMDDLIATFAAANPGVTVEATFGSSGTFFTQVSEGAPFDVYFSADAEYPRKLETAGLAESGSTQLYGIGQIVVWVPNDSALDVEAHGLEALTDPSVKTIAIANPEHAPYGRAAVAAMKTAGIYDAVKSKFVLGENISQAAQFVESGNADIGVIALSLAVAPSLKDKGRYAVVPIDSYPRLEQGAVVLKAAVDPVATRAFLDFVLGPEGRTILDRYAFLLPPS
jgi:molybdate transport system substrate-binding protein